MYSNKTLLQDRYSILHIERTGNFNQVFFALDTYQNPPRGCVIKVFKPLVQKTEIATWIHREFQKEAKYLKELSLTNPHLPEIYSYFSDWDICYLVREVIKGKTLEEKVKTKGKFSASAVRKIIIKFLSLLQELHCSSVVHQNIKPKNIILRDEDCLPMPINFGSIKKIVATYDFYGDRQIFSINNVLGYAPPEQALGKSLPASDLYSLGLTAIYLLTGKNPVELAVDEQSGNFRLPKQVEMADSNLAGIIKRAIATNIGDRYVSAREMLDDLSANKYITSKDNTASKSEAKSLRKTNSNWDKAILVFASLCGICTLAIAYYDWYLNRQTFNTQLYRASITDNLSDESLEELTPETPSVLDESGNNAIAIPILAVGTSKQELRNTLGEPSAIQEGYWSNSNAWIYKNWLDGAIDLGYLFDLDTEKLRQTEVAIASDLDLRIIEDILSSLLQNEISPAISQQLTDVYYRRQNQYFFQLGKLEGSIQREEDDNIYLGVWEADFH